jgi:hypothetical protein
MGVLIMPCVRSQGRRDWQFDLTNSGARR